MHMDASLLRPGAVFNGEVYDSNADSKTPDRLGSINFATSTGYNLLKYIDPADMGDPTNSGLNFILIRYADVLLMYAEAKVELGQVDASAIEAFNQVRRRAGMPEVSTLDREIYLLPFSVPTMKTDPRFGLAATLLAASLGGCVAPGAQAPPQEVSANQPLNVLTPTERASGWRLLFDGRTTEGWHAYGKDGAAGWQVENGTLRGSAGSGDLLSNAEYGSFELSVEWSLERGGNSGILYRVVEDPERFPRSGFTGPEYQVIDDEGWDRPLEPWQHTGSNYALHPATELPTRPVGEWNHSRIVVEGSHVEHWLNGSRVVAYELGSDDWQRRLQESKYHIRPGYGRAESGHIALQDHGGKVRFRNVKIRTP